MHVSHQHAAGPVYRCDRCRYERVNNPQAVTDHERVAHGPVVTSRESVILGPDGKPVTVMQISRR
jgi:hypothetical protein